MWYFQVRCSSRYTPRNLVTLLWIRGWPPKEREKLWLSFLWLGLKVTYVFLILTESLLHLNQTSTFSNSLLSTFFLGPISSKITLTIGKKRRKRKSEKEERRRREKSNGCNLSFHNGYFGEKNCRTPKGPFGGNVFKNPVRCMCVCMLYMQIRPHAGRT